MCYLVAKDRDAHGCFALKMTHGKHLVELKRELNKAVSFKVALPCGFVSPVSKSRF